MDVKDKSNHPFILKFREEDRHKIEFIFSLEFMRNNTPLVSILNIETNLKGYIDRGDKQSPFISKLLETIKLDRKLAIEYGELWKC